MTRTRFFAVLIAVAAASCWVEPPSPPSTVEEVVESRSQNGAAQLINTPLLTTMAQQYYKRDLSHAVDMTQPSDAQRVFTTTCGAYNAGTTPPRTNVSALPTVTSSNTIITVTIFNRGGSFTLGSPAIVDTAPGGSNTYVLDNSAVPGTGIYVYRATITHGGTFGIQINVGQFDYVECDIAVITGVDTSSGSPVLGTSNGSASGTTLSAGTITPVQNAFVLAASGGAQYTTAAATANSPMTGRTVWHDAYGVMDGRVAGGVTSTPTWTLPGSDATAYAVSVAYKNANTGALYDLGRPQDFSHPPDLTGVPQDSAVAGSDGAWNYDLGFPQPTGLGASGGYTRVKSPAHGMHFTAGKPIRLFADGLDVDGWVWLCTRTTAADVRFYVDGVLVSTQAQGDCNLAINYYETRSDRDGWATFGSGLAAGIHTITVKARVCGNSGAPCANGNTGVVIDGDNSAIIIVDPAPTHTNTITISSPLVLSGSTPLTWDDANVTCTGGATVTGSTTGDVTIRNSHISSGCGGYGTNGIDISVTGSGKVLVTDSVFESIGGIRIVHSGTGSHTWLRNELRSSMQIGVSSWDPDAGITIDLSGNTSGAKAFQGNRVFVGQVLFTGMSGWQAGGNHDSEGNLLLGPRTVLRFDGSSGAIVQGNYMHHDYNGGWSQGFNLYSLGGTATMVAENNIIRQGSWPLQGFCGEFRYNVVIDSGHDWARGSCSSSKFHHNIFTHTGGPDGSFNGGLMFYQGETGLEFYNNTFDGNSSLMGGVGFNAPAIAIEGNVSGTPVTVASVRNNIFINFAAQGTSAFNFHNGVVGGGYQGTVGTLTAADYNLFYNNGGVANYSASFVGSYGAHDKTSNPLFALGGEVPYTVDEGAVVSGFSTTSTNLAFWRRRYQPASNSPACDAGNPSDGTGTDIGAIGCGTEAAADLFGIGMDSSWTLPPALLSALRARYGTSQWTTFAAALDSEKNVVQPEGGEYRGNTICQWIPRYAVGWQTMRNTAAWKANTGGARAMARSYGSAALRAIKGCLENYFEPGVNFGAQFVGRGTGAQTAFTLPGTFSTAPTIYTCPATTLTTTRGATPNGADVVAGLSGSWYVHKISLSNDGAPAYTERVSWQHGAAVSCTDSIDCGAAIAWEQAGAEPSNGTTYFPTGCDLSSSLTTKATPADYFISGPTLTFTSAPSFTTLIFVKGIFGTDSADGSTRVENTYAHQAGGVVAMRLDSGYPSRNHALACLGYEMLGPEPWVPLADRAEIEAHCAQISKFITDYCRDISTNGCWDATYSKGNYGSGHERLWVYSAAALEHTRGPFWRTQYMGSRYTGSLLATITDPAPSMAGGYPPEAWGGYGVDSGEYTAEMGAILYQLRWLPNFNALSPWQTWSNSAIEDLISVAPTKSTILQHAEAQGFPGSFSGDRLRSMLPTSDSTHAAEARYVLSGTAGWTFPGFGSDWRAFLWYDPAASTSDPTLALPLAHFAAGIGLMVSRADWTFNSTLVSLHMAGDPQTSASHYGWHAGHVNVYRGGDSVLTTMRNFADDFSPSGQQSREANILVLNDGGAGGTCGQVYSFAEGYWDDGLITATQDSGSGWAFESGDTAPAYYKNNGLHCGPGQRVKRSVLHMLPDHVFVHDDVLLQAGGSTWTVRAAWHSPNTSFNVSGATFKVDYGSGRVYGSAFGPQALTLTDATIVITNESNVSTTTHELQVAAATGSIARRILETMQVTTTANNAPETQASVVDGSGNCDCARIGNDIACFTPGAVPLSTSATVSFTAPAGVTRVALTNLQSSRSYTVTGALAGSYTSTAKGELLVALSGAGGAVTVH